MLNKLVSALQSLTKKKASLDPSYFNDPLALSVDWSPAKSGGTSFKTHNLVSIEDDRYEFQAATGAKVFYGIFFLSGLLFPIAFTAISLYNSDIGLLEAAFPIGFGLIFMGIGGGLWYYGSQPIVFDKISGDFWKGHQNPREVYNKSRLKHYSPLDEVHALQIISEWVGSKNRYHSYELNLVRKDGKRINLVDHGKYDILRQDANNLAEFLNVPLWDAVEALTHFQAIMDREEGR